MRHRLIRLIVVLLVGLGGWHLGQLQARGRLQLPSPSPAAPPAVVDLVPVGRYAESWPFTRESTHESGRLEILVAAGGESGFISPVIEPTRPVRALVAEWRMERGEPAAIEIAVRSRDERGWNGWQTLQLDEEVPDARAHFTTPLLLAENQAFQWRLIQEPGAEVASITIGALPLEPVPAASEILHLPPAPDPERAARPATIARTQWGHALDEPTWRAQPQRPRAFVVHHTATSDGGASPAAVVRAIDVYHRVTRGWGDIGYHYLIDHEGRIYEGRSGGPTSIGAHAYDFNEGTIGIALVGSYDQRDPSAAAAESLVALIAWLSGEYEIAPEGWSQFHGQLFPNVMGHRETGRVTSCPGHQTRGALPEVRRLVAERLTPLPALTLTVQPEQPWVSGQVTVTVAYEEADLGPARLELWLDEAPLKVGDDDYAIQVDTRSLPDGEHHLRAVARRPDGLMEQTTPLRVDNGTPSILLTGPPTRLTATVQLRDETSGLASVAVRRRDEQGNWNGWREIPSLLAATETVTETVRATPFENALALQWHAEDQAGNGIASGIVERPAPQVAPPISTTLEIVTLGTYPLVPVGGGDLLLQLVVINRGSAPLNGPVEVVLQIGPDERLSWLVAAGMPPGAIALLRSDWNVSTERFDGTLPAGQYDLLAWLQPVGSGNETLAPAEAVRLEPLIVAERAGPGPDGAAPGDENDE